MLEDSPLFNAGRGSVYNSDEVQEMDASIMDGKNRLTGAVASVSIVKNPIKLARKVAEETKHVLLVGEGAERFAKDIGVDIVKRNYFYHEERLKRLHNSKRKTTKLNEDSDKIGTVGAVALDKNGNISAATSTGGMTNKMPGRVGDSPIIGSGLFIDNEVGGAVATGLGEEVLKTVGSFLVVELMRQGYSPGDACKIAVERIVKKPNSNYKNFTGWLYCIKQEGRNRNISIQKGFSMTQYDKDGNLNFDSPYYHKLG